MYKLFIVDDEYEIRNGLCKFFPWKEIGFELVGSAENGKQALEFLNKNSVDVLLCDIIMPVMNGIELAQELYKTKSKVKIIFLSGYKDFEYAQKAMEYGVNSYILKSTDYNELIRVFSNIKNSLDESISSTNQTQDKEKNTDSEQNMNEMNFNDKLINIIKKYIDEHFKDVTLENLTPLVHMNPDYISKFFKQRTGQNFSDYLIEVRMKKAAQLLDDIRYKTYEVSDMVGYTNSFNFTRTFKSYYGITPRDYRNKRKIEEE